MEEPTFLRPLWLLGVLVVPALAYILWTRVERTDPWHRICDAGLLMHLRTRESRREGAAPYLLGAALGIAGAIGLAGPSFNPIDVSLHRAERAVVVALDLSRSMDATDVAPSRLERAREKTAAVLRRNADGQSGLVVFAGDAFAIAPLTTDARMLSDILPAFDTSVLPEQGSRPARALRRARELLARSGHRAGEVILVSDGARGDGAIQVAGQLRDAGIMTSVLAVGTAEGAPVPIGGGANLRNLKGEEIIATTRLDLLEAIATAGGGRFARATEDESDLDTLLRTGDGQAGFKAADREVRILVDQGPWIALLLVPLAALAFRRGWLAALAVVALVPAPGPAAASEPQTTPAAMAEPSGRGFRWDAVKLYRERRYLEAAELFSRADTADDHYNRGNALAHAGLLQAAVAAYAAAIARAPVHEDARYNRAIVERLIEQQPRDAGARNESAGDLELVGDEADGSDGLSSAASETVEARPSDGAGVDPERSAQSRERDLSEISDQVRDRSADGEESESATAEREAPGEGLSQTRIEAMEAALNEISRDRSGLWKRKLELEWKWRNRARGLAASRPARSDAW